MKNVRVWGSPPYRIAVIHGGPGAPGSIAPLARELSKDRGVLEPLQTKNTIEGQVQELAGVLEKHAAIPVTLVGWSWGAALSMLTTARFPALVKKLILVGSVQMFTASLPDNTPAWLERLSEDERREFLALTDFTWDGKEGDKNASLGKLMRLIARAESYDPIPAEDTVLAYQLDINMAIGLELRKLVASGKLVRLGNAITCPVVAIQGDYDPRRAEDIKDSFSGVINDFRFILLEKCGHYPWLEKQARGEFLRILREEVT